jgi:hypothetical protein
MKDVIHPKYNLDSLNRKVWDDEHDALAIAEVGFWAWRGVNEGPEKIKPLLKPHELEVLYSEKRSTNGKPKGICLRPDDFYLRRIQSA